uniref:Peptidase S1 domain-containing protein n=1 Tax=Strongyloides papillosus TaxID=174720 RepID=A0A0N5BTU9_STREA
MNLKYITHGNIYIPGLPDSLVCRNGVSPAYHQQTTMTASGCGQSGSFVVAGSNLFAVNDFFPNSLKKSTTDFI